MPKTVFFSIQGEGGIGQNSFYRSLPQETRTRFNIKFLKNYSEFIPLESYLQVEKLCTWAYLINKFSI